MYGVPIKNHLVGQHEGFSYHSKCKSLKLNHLCFADDVLLFCEGEWHAVTLVVRGLKTFSMASGLTTNNIKSNMYFASMEKRCIEDLCEISMYQEGKLFNYLGMPISPRKLTICDGL